MKKGRLKVVVIGGGTGTYTLLSGLKNFPIDLSVIVSMMDSGGSNRVIRDEFGLLPTSDIRQCIVALSQETPSDILRKLFTYRYNAGTGISGMTFGNLFMAALTDIYGSQKQAIKKTCEFLDVSGNIVPVTYEHTHLVARYDTGRQVLGEHFIDEPKSKKVSSIVELSVFPPVRANREAIGEIRRADKIVLGPGDLFTSTLANLVVGSVAGEIKKSKAKVFLVVNLMTRFGQTTNFKASDHVREIEKKIGRGRIDKILVNKNGNFPKGILKRYKQEGASPVVDDLKNNKKVIRKKFFADRVFEKASSDKLTRSLIRHDPLVTAREIVEN